MKDLSTILKSDVILPLSKQVTLNLIYTTSLVSDKNTSFFKKYKLSAPQYNVLRILRGQKMKPINLSSIQERMIHKSSNAGRLVDKLVTKGLVGRSICKENRRNIEIIISQDGLDLLFLIEPELNILENENLKNLNSDELLLLNSLLEKLRD
jgi:DNA-binding MarR family transcriptional regulator